MLEVLEIINHNLIIAGTIWVILGGILTTYLYFTQNEDPKKSHK